MTAGSDVSARLLTAATLAEQAAAKATPGPWSAADEHGLLEGADPAWCVSRMRPGYESMSETEGYLYDIAYTTGTNEAADAMLIAASGPSHWGAVAGALRAIAQAHRKSPTWMSCVHCGIDWDVDGCTSVAALLPLADQIIRDLRDGQNG